MKNLFMILVLAPSFLSANLLALKKELELKIKLNLIEIECNHLMNKNMFLHGKSQAYFEVIDMIEYMENENASKEKRS